MKNSTSYLFLHPKKMRIGCIGHSHHGLPENLNIQILKLILKMFLILWKKIKLRFFDYGYEYQHPLVANLTGKHLYTLTSS